jgi:hypothetical protein
MRFKAHKIIIIDLWVKSNSLKFCVHKDIYYYIFSKHDMIKHLYYIFKLIIVLIGDRWDCLTWLNTTYIHNGTSWGDRGTKAIVYSFSFYGVLGNTHCFFLCLLWSFLVLESFWHRVVYIKLFTGKVKYFFVFTVKWNILNFFNFQHTPFQFVKKNIYSLPRECLLIYKGKCSINFL